MQKKIVSVVINNPARSLDKLFYYIVPDNLVGDIEVGKRVIVPFGRGNKKIQAYILQIVTETEIDKLKGLIKVIDSEPLFNEKLVMLTRWMRRRYLCTYYEAIKCITPPGSNIKIKQYIKLIKSNNDVLNRNDITILQKEIIKLLLDDSNLEKEYEELKRCIGKNVFSSLKSLEKKKIIDRSYESVKKVKDKKVKIVSLNADYSEVKQFIDDKKQAPVQKRILKELLENDSLRLSELIDISKGNYSSVNSLFQKGYIDIKEDICIREVINNTGKNQSDYKLTIEQMSAVNIFLENYKNSDKKPFLLHGVTGSGKTEVYIRLTRYFLEQNKSSIILVPEISLTTQIIQRFVERFGDKIAVFHSGLSLGERYDQWKKVLNSEEIIVIGARSAVFSPVNNLGLIVVDEEHETTYKSDSSPRYDAKEVARFRVQNEGSALLYSSATPSIESYYKANKGLYKLIEMKSRYNNNKMPEVEIVDMRKEFVNNNEIFSNKLYEAIKTNLETKKQTILFINRRGYSSFVSCRKCGYVQMCPNCNITLKYHINNNTLMCHYCGYMKKNISICPECSSKHIKYFGLGTQKIEEEIKKTFPNAKLLRMDVDTTSRKNSFEKIMDTFSKEKADILIGTQMVTKGLDFKNVTLIGIISADILLNIDDYRAAERSFQLLTQVSGRAGRGLERGRAIIQTYQPDNMVVQLSKEHDYTSFYNNEIDIRKQLNYPPFCMLCVVNVEGIIEEEVISCVKKLKEKFKDIIVSRKVNKHIYEILGPSPAPVSRIKNNYRWRFIVKSTNDWESRDILCLMQKESLSSDFKNINLYIDINPVNMQ